MTQRLASILLVIVFALTALTAMATPHDHSVVGEHASECHTCRVAIQPVDLPEPATTALFVPAAFRTADIQAAVHVVDGRNLFRLTPKTSPPAIQA
jgi:hypothetical protein